jgi:hypothetical protein
MRAVYAANFPHITTTPALIPQAFRLIASGGIPQEGRLMIDF